MISFDDIKTKTVELGYYATDELLYDTYNALVLFENTDRDFGQDIYAICLEGPPGSGKTEFANTYTKLSNALFKDVELVEYQCDGTTGKAELYEDIDVGAAVSGDASKVKIPGKIIEAIKKVNEGKRVVLFIDEYDKAREETDAFLLQFLQSGKINTTQHGDLGVKEEYKSRLQVIFCKNDMREELSGPLSRRIRIIRLDYMEPSIFYKVAQRKLIAERKQPVDAGLVNLVSLMYESAYSNRDLYDRLPSCSEMLIALQDADRVLRINAPQSVIYNIIIRNMFKSPDDITTFESSINRKNNKLGGLIEDMKNNTAEQEEMLDLNSLIAEKVFVGENKKLVEKTQEMQELIDKYSTRFTQMEADRKKAIEDEINKIKLENGKLVSHTNMPNVIGNFHDESSHIKRGYNIFTLSDSDWTDVATLSRPTLSYSYVIDKLKENVSNLGIVMYENGILLNDFGGLRLIVINETDKDNNQQFRFLSNTPVIPSIFIKDIENFIKFMCMCFQTQPKEKNVQESYSLNINTLLYNDVEMDLNTAKENVYHLEGIFGEPFSRSFMSLLKCDDSNKVLEVSKEIMGNAKVKNERH